MQGFFGTNVRADERRKEVNQGTNKTGTIECEIGNHREHGKINVLGKEPSEKARDIERKDIARKEIDHNRTNLRKSSSTELEDERETSVHRSG